MNTSARERPTFTVTLTLRPEPGVDPIHALRALLKVALRRFGLRATSIDARLIEEKGINADD